jgi:hypothetical protein
VKAWVTAFLAASAVIVAGEERRQVGPPKRADEPALASRVAQRRDDPGDRAQAPVVNARVERRTVTQGLAREIQAVADRGTAAWIGYTVPLLRRSNATPRSADWWGGRCRLEPPTDLVVLVRAEAKALIEVRSFSIDCDVDAAGMPLVWLDGVNAEESVKWLASIVGPASATTPRDRMANVALAALAQHATPAAAAPLVDLARNGTTTQVRTRALSLLAMRPANESLSTIDAAIDQDADRQVRRQAVTALSRLPDGAGVPRLMELARTHKDQEIRRQAMQALGQSRDPRATEFFSQILK